MNTEIESSNEKRISTPILAVRSLIGGLLMGLANLLPGISGGTMLLVAGIYTNFIESLSDLTRFRFRFRSLLVMGMIVLAAGLGILLLAGSIKDLVLDHRWVMYSLFIGLTLGGLPVVLRMTESISNGLLISAGISFAVMVALAMLQISGVVGSGNSNFIMLFLAGLAGASAMILPGLSGGYLLLLMGQYVPILSAIDQFKEALKAGDVSAAMEPALNVLFPVGIGVVAGVVIIGNLLKWLLHRYRTVTLGILIGLLIGSVAGLWPFQEGVPPVVGDIIKNQTVTVDNINEFKKKDWLVKYFPPAPGQIGVSIALIIAGFGITQAIALVGRSKNVATENPSV